MQICWIHFTLNLKQSDLFDAHVGWIFNAMAHMFKCPIRRVNYFHFFFGRRRYFLLTQSSNRTKIICELFTGNRHYWCFFLSQDFALIITRTSQKPTTHFPVDPFASFKDCTDEAQSEIALHTTRYTKSSREGIKSALARNLSLLAPRREIFSSDFYFVIFEAQFRSSLALITFFLYSRQFRSRRH